MLSTPSTAASAFPKTTWGTPICLHSPPHIFNNSIASSPSSLPIKPLSPTLAFPKRSIVTRNLVLAKSAANSIVGSHCEIPHELELLLTPDEMEILKKNEVPDLNKLSTSKWNLMHTFALSGQIKIMDKLIEYDLHADAIDKGGYTALHKAVIGKKEAVISHLLRKGANPHVKDWNGATPLHYAVQVGAIQTVKLLIKYNVDVNVADNEGWTPLHIAAQCRSRDITKILLINGADKTRRNKDGRTALDIAFCYGKNFKSYDIARLLKILPADGNP